MKYRVKDNKLKEKIKARTVYICERHFQESDIEFYKWEEFGNSYSTGASRWKLGH